MTFRVGQNASNSARKKSTDAVVQAVDFGTTNSTGRILFYTGTQVASPETTAAGVLLVTFNFANPSFASSNQAGSSGMSGGISLTATAVANGTPGWFRATDRDNNPIFDGSVTATGGPGDITFDNIVWASGGNVTLSSLVISTPM